MAGIDGFTKLILHCDGLDTSTSFPDSSLVPHTVTPNGNAQVDTAQSKFGGASVLLDGSGDSLHVPDSADWAFGTGDFTIDLWVRFNTINTNDVLVSPYDDGGSNRCLFAMAGSGALQFFATSAGVTIANFQTPASVFTTGVWHHVALVRNGGNEFIFIDGVAQTLSYVVNPTASTNYPNASSVLRIGDQAFGWHFDGHMDEIRVSKGIARWTANFTPPTAPYSAPETVTVNETITFTDSETLLTNPEQIIINEGISFNDVNDSYTNPELIQVNENIYFNDTNSTFIPLNAKNGSKIISVNPLIFVTFESPAKIVHVDTTTPTAPVFTETVLVGVNLATDASYNTNTDKIYVSCADGKLVEVDFNNFSTQNVIDLSDLDDLKTVETSLDGLVFTTTEDDTGEMYLLDNRETQTIDTDFHLLLQKRQIFETDFACLEASIFDTAVYFLSWNNFTIDTHFSCLPAPITDIDPIKQTDVIVYVDNVALDPHDVLLDTVTIVESVDEKTTVTFTLCRRHDDFNTDINGNTVEISNKNDVKIDIDGITRFQGKVSSYAPSYGTQTDEVVVTALSLNNTESGTNNVTLSLAGLTDKLDFSHILLQDFDIVDPYIDANDTNPEKYKGVRASLGDCIEEQVVRRTFFDSLGRYAEDIQSGSFVFLQNYQYFWTPTVKKFGNYQISVESSTFQAPDDEDINGLNLPVFRFGNVIPFDNIATGDTTAIHFKYIGTSLNPVSGDLWELINATYRRQRIFENTIKKMGEGFITVAELDALGLDGSSVFSELQSKGWIDGTGNMQEPFKFLTESSELNLTISSCAESSVYELMEKNLGHYVGEAPFLDVSPKNGKLITKFKWVDEPNGLYSIKAQSHDYTEFVKKVVNLEYEKLKNSNGDILPDTTSTIDVSIDALMHYGLKVLNKINIDNTTETGVFKNKNGFPVRIKSITIDVASMTATLACDNALSSQELSDLEGDFPCEEDQEYVEPQRRILIDLKSDMKTRLKVE